LEVGDNEYTVKYGKRNNYTSHVLHIIEGNSKATIVGDLTNLEHVPDKSFNCIILTQVLHLIYDMPAAVNTLHRILKPGGTLLLTVPGISQVKKCDWGDDWHWSLTIMSARKMLGEHFEDLQVSAYGNVLVAISFLEGISAEELKTSELDYIDNEYQTLVTVVAKRTHSTQD